MKKVILAIAACAFLIGISPFADAESGPGGSAKAVPTPAGKMPQVILISSIAKTYGPVKFDHASHVSNAGACAECHHQHGTGESLACGECHGIDPTAFKKSVKLAKMQPCRACHSSSYPDADPGRPGLKAAYHRACFKCHRGDVGSVGKDPKGCVEMCHVPAPQAKLGRKP